MSEKFRILIAYDGSDCAEAAIKELMRAGLPASAEAIVLTVADVFVPEPVNEEIDNTFPFYVPEGVKRAHAHAARELEKAKMMSEEAAARVREIFPGWDVCAESCADSPAWAIIRRADEWKPDLVVVGAQGHAVLGGRLILGSVSQRVLYEASSSVRVARSARLESDSPVRILIGVDGSADAEKAVSAVAGRSWPNGTEVRLVTAVDTVMQVTVDPGTPSVVKWVETDTGRELIEKAFEALAQKLRTVGVSASIVVKKGSPQHVLIEEAESWGADMVFVGAKGVRGIDRILLGSVSAAVAARAQCSVEVVRT
ncbi:MAG TPA: universal stress protein [Pyrinomonadaceae bacterium]|nr:universal stress protein [Pyrinomonadaceae bacterium]